MIDCALLTQKGIVFCLLPTETLQILSEKLHSLDGEITIEVNIGEGSKERIYHVRPEFILVRYYFAKAQRG